MSATSWVRDGYADPQASRCADSYDESRSVNQPRGEPHSERSHKHRASVAQGLLRAAPIASSGVARKLGEALARRNELQTRVTEIRDRLRISALVQEGDTPPEDPEPLLRELDEVARELERLIANINRTNSSARLASGMTLTQGLARRDVLGLLHGSLKAVADATAQQQARYSRSEIRLVTDV